jgi:hypothetical protein
VRLSARGTQRLAWQLRLALEPERLKIQPVIIRACNVPNALIIPFQIELSRPAA